MEESLTELFEFEPLRLLSGFGGSCSMRLRRLVFIVPGVLLTAGVGLRVMALLAWWPVAPKLGDPGLYSAFAAFDPLASPMHPDGYSLFLAAFTSVTRSVEVVVIAQHAMGVAAGLSLFLAVRRLCGSPWPALVGAATILLGADQVFLEHTIMSETLFVLLLSLVLYAVARMLEAPDRWWPWPAVAGALLAAAGMTRVAGLFLIPVVVLALLLIHPRPWSGRWRPTAMFLGVAATLLFAYGTANAISNGDFEIAPTPGYHLYGRVGPFADCSLFDPPPGTQRLCEHLPPEDRPIPHPNFYLFGWNSPGIRLIGREPLAGLLDAQRRDVTRAVVQAFARQVRDHDRVLGAFARQAVLHQPVAYAEAVGRDVRAYFLSDGDGPPFRAAQDLGPALDWDTPPAKVDLEGTEVGMENLFEPFTARRDHELLAALRDYQRVFRFGATALTVTTLLILIGLLMGPRRNRVAVLVLGGGGLAMFVLPTLSIAYVARYTVPVAGLMTAGAAVAVLSMGERMRTARARHGIIHRPQERVPA